MGKSVLKAGSPEEVFQTAKIDYTHLVVVGSTDSSNFGCQFPVTPTDYLRYARLDFKEGQQRGLINALSNAKRCIDCLIESVLRSLGIAPHNIPNTALTFCNTILHGKEKALVPLNLRLFSALGLAPSFLISEVRLLRNKVEHEYEIPESDDVLKAIEVSELLLNTVKAKELYSDSIEITDTKRQPGLPKVSDHITGIYFGYQYDAEGENDRSFYLNTSIDEQKDIGYKFRGDEIEFFFLLRAMFIASHDETSLEETIRLMLQQMKLKTPKEHINVAQVYVAGFYRHSR